MKKIGMYYLKLAYDRHLAARFDEAEKAYKQYEELKKLYWNLEMQKVLEKTAIYDMSLMSPEQNIAYQRRLDENRMNLRKRKSC
jgi:hypothetical protein